MVIDHILRSKCSLIRVTFIAVFILSICDIALGDKFKKPPLTSDARFGTTNVANSRISDEEGRLLPPNEVNNNRIRWTNAISRRAVKEEPRKDHSSIVNTDDTSSDTVVVVDNNEKVVHKRTYKPLKLTPYNHHLIEDKTGEATSTTNDIKISEASKSVDSDDDGPSLSSNNNEQRHNVNESDHQIWKKTNNNKDKIHEHQQQRRRVSLKTTQQNNHLTAAAADGGVGDPFEKKDNAVSASGSNRLKIRRKIVKTENVNSILDENKFDDQQSSSGNHNHHNSYKTPFKAGSTSSNNGGPTILKKSDSLIPPNKDDNNKYKLVCYYTNWSQYRPKIGKFLPDDIDAHLCTHIIYAFGWLRKGKLSSYESNDETVDGKIGLYDRIMNLKKSNPKLIILLAIGGWSFGTQKFKEMSATRYTRQTFIYSAILFLRKHNFDGLDIDWEYPKGPEDKKNFVLLLKELREAFEAESQEVNKSRLLLTAAVPVGPDDIKSGYDVPAVASYLDFINVMAYDFHGKWEREVGHNAPLYAPSSDSEWRKQLSVSNAASTWAKLGAAKNKLIIGMPTYGRTFTLSNIVNFKVNSPNSGGGRAGQYTKEAGFLAYYEICQMLLTNGTYIWDDEMKVPYLIAHDQWVGFDDERSIRNKMTWLKENGYGGAMIWTVDMDDFTGTVCGSGIKYPLITAMREELLGIKRSENVNDVDWSKIANARLVENVATLPIVLTNVSEIIAKAKSSANGPSQILQDANVVSSSARPAQVFCYMTSWSQKRPGLGKFTPENIDTSLCSHVIYAFGSLKGNELVVTGEEEEKNYEKLISLKEKQSTLKVLLAIGGWTFGSTPFKELTNNIFRMNQFVYEAIEFLRKYKFDGLDIDWEYPRGTDDKNSYTNLLKELRTAFEGEAKTSKQPRLLLTAAVPASFEAIAAGYNVPEISKYLDFINVMTYDFHGQWERQVGHNSPLYPLESATSFQKKLTVDYSAKEWFKQGAPKEKLMIGMPTYGRSFTLLDSEKFDIGSAATSGASAGQYTGESGFMAYYEICEFLQMKNTTLVWDNEQQVPFAYHDKEWVGFDDERSLKMKMKWLKENGFGGIMVWSVDMDDFRGSCATGKYPLMQAMKQELEGYSVNLVYDGPYETVVSTKSLQNVEDGTGGLSCEEEDGFISYHADKSDCTMYYMCEGERKHHMPCPTNLVFNPEKNVCDWPENVEGCNQQQH